MSLPLENMNNEQLRKLLLKQNEQIEVLEKEAQTIVQKMQALSEEKETLREKAENMTGNLTEEIKVLREKTENLNKKNERILLEKTELEKKLQDILLKFTSVKFELAQLKRLIYGSKRERFVADTEDGQMSLPFEVTQPIIDTEPPKEEIKYTRRKPKNENHNGRLPLPDHLPVDEIVIEPQQNTTGLKCIGNDITDELEYVPGKLKINRYIRPKYAVANNEGVIVAPMPTRPIEKCIAGPGLLSQLFVDKFVDHLPFYRQAQRYEREGVKIPRSTIDNWQTLTANLLWPLYNELKRQVLGQGYIQADETPIKVLDRKKKGKCHRGYHWVYRSPIKRLVLYDYKEGRGREYPKKLLRDFQGYLQTDGYSVYDWFDKKEGITLINCMAHARRIFEKALIDDKKRASYAMSRIQELYLIEQKAREKQLSVQQRHELRLDESLPILNSLSNWMVEQVRTTLPKSPFGKALIYSISRWDNLMGYLKDGHLEIDNNLVENAIRPNALGRKNYLFAGSHAGAQRAAMFYSFFGTCKANDVNPFQWLEKVLTIIPDYSANKLSDLLPQNLNLED